MNWYLAKIVWGIRIGNSNAPRQFEEQLRLIRAAHHPEAFEKAKRMGIEEESSFINASGKKISWEFVAVAELTRVDLSDGTVLQSQLNEPDEVSSYLHFVQHKGRQILQPETV